MGIGIAREEIVLMRLNKYIAGCGICSRRDADKLIETGKVLVNGKVATNGMQIDETKDEVCVNHQVISYKRDHVVLAYYKPVGVTCTERDVHAKKTVIEDIGYNRRITYAGRLDKDSEGLLLMTDDGDLIQAMMKGSNYHEKEYQVKVNKEIKDVDIEKLRSGIYLRELDKNTKPCDVEKTGKYTFDIVLTQGLNRQIRRMCKEIGYEVVKLKRTRVMNVFLASMKTGEVRELSEKEQSELYRLCGLKS